MKTTLSKIKYKIGKNLTFSQWKNRNFLKKEASTLQGKILDLGCGKGEYSFLMAKNKNNEITALDCSKELCGEIQKELFKKDIPNIKVIETDGTNLPFKEETFDACFCNTVLEHIPEPNQIISEIGRVLKKNGKLLISIPFLQEIHADPEDYQRYTPFGLKALLEKYHFNVEKTFCDYGALNTLEYLLLGSVVWRIRLGFWKNFPSGYVYIFCLLILFLLLKIFHLIFFILQKEDRHFITQVSLVASKK